MTREGSKPRFVRCPKCLRLLMEIADVPVYKCGVCGTILQAKVRHVDLQQNPSCSTSENSSRGVESNDLSEEGDPPSCRANPDTAAGSAPGFPYATGQPAATGADTISVASAPQSQLDGSGTHSKHGSVNSLESTESVISEEEVLDEIPGSSQIRNPVPSIASSCHSYELGVSSGGGISGKHERYRSLSRRTFSNRNPPEPSKGGAKDRKEGDLAGKNQTAPPNEIRPQSQLDGSGTHSKHGSVNSLESTESVISEEEVLDGIPGNSQIRNPVPSTASSSPSYELGVSSGDDISSKHERYRRLSRRTFSNRNPSESSNRGAGDLAGKNQTAPPNEMRDASNVGISGLKHRSSSRNYAHTSEPDDRSRSGSFFPLQNETESDHLSSASRSPSRDSTSAEDFPCDALGGIPSNRLGNLQRDREMEPPRRVDLPRDRPANHCAGGRRGDQRVPVGGSRHDGHRLPVFSNAISERVPTALYTGDMSQWQSAASGRKPNVQKYQSQGIPFSAAEGSGSRLHHHSEAWRVPAHCRPRSPQTYFHPSAAASSGFSDRDVSLCHSGESGDHHRGKLPGKEKRQHKKRRHCRPVSGGAPFVVCNKCYELLQLPVDFLISRGRLHKLRCGACSEVLTFLYQGGHIVPHHASSIQQLSDHPSQDTLHEDPVSYSEENGPPASRSNSTDGEPCAPRSSPEEKGKERDKQQMGGPPLHHHLGYASARDLIFVPAGDEDDEIYQSTDMSRFRRDPDDVHDQGCGGTGRSSPAVGCSPNHSEIEEEEEEKPVLGLPAGSRGRPAVLGFVGGDAEHLSHGLENMKLRSNRSRRPR